MSLIQLYSGGSNCSARKIGGLTIRVKALEIEIGSPAGEVIHIRRQVGNSTSISRNSDVGDRSA
jgi:hypothetical protein